MSKIIELGGRKFVAVTGSTIEHDYWLMDMVRRAGLDQIVVPSDTSTDSIEEFMRELLSRCISDGRVFLLMGGLIMPEGKQGHEWTVGMAQETADFIKRLTKPEDKAAVQTHVVSMLLGFFQNGLVSLLTSRKSSTSPETHDVSATASH